MGAVSKPKPHILLVLADDLGFANVGWNRKDAGVSTKEVQTPIMDALVEDGVQLTRFYAYHSCSPTRSGLQTGRFSLHVNYHNEAPTIYNASSASGVGAGIPRNMTCVASKLKKAGYHTHIVGKWDAGMATPTHTPHGRGYDTALTYFHHSNNGWELRSSDNNCKETAPDGGSAYDLYDTLGPAYGMTTPHDKVDHTNITAFEEFRFEQRLLDTIKMHNPSEPLFLMYSSRMAHVSYDVPDQYVDKLAPYYADKSKAAGASRLKYNAMVNFLHGSIGNITAALKAKGMWDDTFMLFFSDNGGPTYLSGNNYPLRGGKYSEFEGGVRVAAFASGGLVPKKARGTRHAGLASYADVYTTLCDLAGVDAADEIVAKAGLPPVDGMSLASMILEGANSPRQEVPLSPLKTKDVLHWQEYQNKSSKQPSMPIIGTAAGMIVGDLKIVTGTVKMADWSGPTYPNASTHKPGSFTCSKKGKIACVFNITADPTENHDLALARPDDALRLMDTLVKWSATQFDPERGVVDPRACKQIKKNKGFYGPWLELDDNWPQTHVETISI